ncbi:MAG TPA: zinc ribbon domain-containing protein [Gemmatimonadaceae bacterium]|nr:zinc ribbon domain-containing protein [Gemmatimonadaceae bacterium]
MNAALVALVAGTVLAIAALAFVLYPLFFDVPATRTTVRRGSEPWSDDVAALREIEFDRATGKLSDADYSELKAQYTRQALASMRRSPDAVTESVPTADDEVEAAIRAYRAERPACATCGPRPEADASFCSNCGRFLSGACEHCGRHVEEIGARFCAACGHRLAA